MNYQNLFSSDVPSFMRSPVREIFRKVDLSAICSFAGGYPAAVTFPVEDLRKLPGTVLDKYGTKALQYGATQGVPELREAIASRYGVPVSKVQITTSSQQGIDVCTRILCDPGDVVLTTEPTYLGALQSFKAYRADVKPLSWAEEGILSGTRIKFIYVIPDFNNPSGETMTLAERERIVALARELDVVIVEDSPYRELRYSGEEVPTIYSLAPERTLHLGSFSKIFAPGFRLGWIIGPEELLEQIYICKQALDLCPPVFDQYMAAEFLVSGALDANLVKTKAEYRRRRDLMVSLLEKYMPEGVSWTYPEGGLFLFLTLPEGVDTIDMYDEALSKGVAYVAGSFFFLDGSHRNTMRLNFSFIAEEKMEPGLKLLADIVRGVISRKPALYKFSGAGNDFVVIDGRGADVSAFREVPRIAALCRQYKTDGLMILDSGDAGVDFTMEFYNPDGSGGMMCGNGGRCIVAFADHLGIRPARDRRTAEGVTAAPGVFLFRAPDGLHTGEILERPGKGDWVVRIKMIDVQGITPMLGGLFLNTGTRHFVKFVPDVEKVDVAAEGKVLRWNEAFAPAGTNVNFVHVAPDGLHVRTFEKGVEGETLACGTGLTACALAAHRTGVPTATPGAYRLRARQDWLSVDFTPGPDDTFTDVYLTGPARLIGIQEGSARG